ncbi:heH/LEM domain protein [Kurthia sp. 11kri321]|uniref:HeH/LEM domain-containing protein n=1 Tax=Kurthia sp. 11kri321 TaxID=1750719 RepID=UPI000745C780|nr:HeH/LEM domain-containing protein [Kurthia sp. 11kri321]AMA62346.1 heH/LEM domain protein [Kurthia sp. 11kri321]
MMLRRYHEQKESNEVEAVDYESLKVDELKQLLDQREIAYTSEMKKADLIGLLVGEENATN